MKSRYQVNKIGSLAIQMSQGLGGQIVSLNKSYMTLCHYRKSLDVEKAIKKRRKGPSQNRKPKEKKINSFISIGKHG